MWKGKRFAENFEAKGGVCLFLAKYASERVSAYLKMDTFKLSY